MRRPIGPGVSSQAATRRRLEEEARPDPLIAEALSAIYRASVPGESSSYDSNLKAFQDRFCDRAERLAKTPRLPWFQFLRRWQVERARRQLGHDIALKLAIDRENEIGAQRAASHGQTATPKAHGYPVGSFSDSSHYWRAAKGYPLYGYMSPPTD
jgi:hypothetical protein